MGLLFLKSATSLGFQSIVPILYHALYFWLDAILCMEVWINFNCCYIYTKRSLFLSWQTGGISPYHFNPIKGMVLLRSQLRAWVAFQVSHNLWNLNCNLCFHSTKQMLKSMLSYLAFQLMHSIWFLAVLSCVWVILKSFKTRKEFVCRFYCSFLLYIYIRFYVNF